MKISLEWLNEFVDLTDTTPEQIAHELTMSGLEVEEIEKTGPKFSNIKTAQIKLIENHPNADKLHLVTVDLGNETKTVVCGAQNIQEGQIIPYASVGSKFWTEKQVNSLSSLPQKSEVWNLKECCALKTSWGLKACRKKTESLF